jgi:hypothetical protein
MEKRSEGARKDPGVHVPSGMSRAMRADHSGPGAIGVDFDGARLADERFTRADVLAPELAGEFQLNLTPFR